MGVGGVRERESNNMGDNPRMRGWGGGGAEVEAVVSRVDDRHDWLVPVKRDAYLTSDCTLAFFYNRVK